jgi:ketosteroid isomerase-like protein
MQTRRAPLRWTFVNHDPALAADLLHEYVEGWVRQDIPAVLTTLAEDCVVVEADGRSHRGRDRVEWWMKRWFATGGRVEGWQITSSASTGELLVAEWQRVCSSQGGGAMSVVGATIARPVAGRIGHLREYVTARF